MTWGVLMKHGFGRLLRRAAAYTARTLTLLLAVSTISFALVSASPVDPVQQYILGLGTAVSPEQRAQIGDYWGVDEPPAERYLGWLASVLHGDLGESSLYRRSVADILSERFTNSLALMLCAWLLSGVIGFAAGCVMGTYRGKWPDRALKRLCYTLSSIPAFWLGLMLLLLFAVKLGWLPIGFSAPVGVLRGDVTLGQRLRHLLLPALSLALTSFSGVALHTRQKLIGMLESDYVLFARARGEGRWTVLRRHGLRNILLPALTLQFASFAELFGGSVLAENVFSYAGLGSAVSEAGLQGDVPLLLGATLFSALFVCAGNLIADLLCAAADPRIRRAAR